MINLYEPLAAKAARSMVIDNQAKDSFNLINKALMVLAEQGLFAFGLFLNSQRIKKTCGPGKSTAPSEICWWLPVSLIRPALECRSPTTTGR